MAKRIELIGKILADYVKEAMKDRPVNQQPVKPITSSKTNENGEQQGNKRDDD